MWVLIATHTSLKCCARTCADEEAVGRRAAQVSGIINTSSVIQRKHDEQARGQPQAPGVRGSTTDTRGQPSKPTTAGQLGRLVLRNNNETKQAIKRTHNVQCCSMDLECCSNLSGAAAMAPLPAALRLAVMWILIWRSVAGRVRL